MPNTGRSKTATRFQMKIEARTRMDFPGAEMWEACCHVSLVRTLVLREADVAIDSKERAAVRSWIRNKTRTDSVKHRSKVRDEAQERVAHRCFKSVLVLGKPFSVVVGLEFL